MAVKNAMAALSILRERERGFELVLTDVHMPDMDGFELLKHIEEDFKVPVVMMSANDKENVMLRGLECGAILYLLKPVSLNDLKNLWQYAIAAKKVKRMEVEQTGSVRGELSGKISEEDMECESSVNEGNWKQQDYKRKISKEMDENQEEDEDDSTTQKKTRVVWTSGLHNQFLEAIEHLGLDAVPKKILERMNVPGLSRENVASHLQKYRIFLKRVQDASQSLEPSLVKTLTSGTLKSSFASRHPSLIFNLQHGFARLPEKQNLWTAFKPGFGSNSQGLNAPIPMPSLGPALFLNREMSSRKAMPQLGYGQSFPVSKHANLQQPLLGTGSSLNQRNDANYLGLGGQPHNFQMGSLLSTDVSSGLARGADAVPMIQQQPDARPGIFESSPLDHNFSTLSVHGHNNIPSLGNMGSFGNLNQPPNFNFTMYNNNNSSSNYSGIQMNSNGELFGMGQMEPVGGESSNNGNNFSNNLIDEILKGKMTVAAAGNSDYAARGTSISGGLGSGNQFLTMFPNLIQQQPPPATPQSQEQHNSIGTEEGEDVFFDLLKSNTAFENNSLPQPYEQDDLGDIAFKPVDQSFNQACDEEVVDPEFSISAYQMEDNPGTI
ncbi:hypothetical protein HHK36_028848 [Tetracentron sinense]|uniref:Two-component response regulator n=1 Tax=Tetracentron sinense TaxID=13715 RepID=A0A834YD70_TETSI|nr:hypothetical protein HHK36_028848 [Tetracentron sinense]